MSFLIKGMKMPKDCENCPMLDDNGDYPTCILTWTSQGYNWSSIGHRMRDCPLVEVPPHVRLVDVDALKAYWQPDHDREFCADYFIHTLEVASTIIEAEDGGNNV